ncbi:signal transduction histidine kinase [Thermotomaculum hydrothermale]|uniref:Signal transduction histidine kinase n=1 Tax=Thermotomaculum hydrothermale TaxID=981385 RepID=A0A7R6PFN3_9BACT|nr:PAS domain S-box protein [Thermotomaculum hydrothermale]BBB32868.1 signal transduction histidine kinase [Thermotomaculum hydrothermale]
MIIDDLIDVLNIPFGIFNKNNESIYLSPLMRELEENYGDIFDFLEIDDKSPVYLKGVSVEKRLMLNGETKSFVFFIQKADDFFIILAIDITYNTDLINSIVERGRLLSQVLSLCSAGIFLKEFDGNFIYKNLSFERFLNSVDYPEKTTLQKIKENGYAIEIRPVFFEGKERYIFELLRRVEVSGKEAVGGLVLFDGPTTDFLGNIMKKSKMLSEIIDLSETGVLYFSRDFLSLEFFNKKALDILTKERIERIKVLGLFEPDVLFDKNTVAILKESFLLNGSCEIFNYKIPNVEGEFNFYIVSGLNGISVFFKKVLPTEEEKAYHQFKSMFEFASDAIFLMKNATFVECNKKAEEMFGCTKSEIIGKTPFDFSPEFQPNGIPSEEGALKMIDEATVSGNKVFEWVHRKCDGTLFDSEVTLSKFQVGGYTYTQAIVRNITERKAYIDLGREFENLIASTNPVFVFNQEFSLVMKNTVESDLSVEEAKKYAISVLNKNSMVYPGAFSGNIEINGKNYLCQVKIVYSKGEKYFLVTIEKL